MKTAAAIEFLSRNWEALVAAAAYLHAVALAIVNLTPTPKDNAALARLYRIIEVMAGIVSKLAKQPPGAASAPKMRQAPYISSTEGQQMSFDFSDFTAKMSKVVAALPAMGQMVQAAEMVFPGVKGITKANFVISTITAAAPALMGCEQIMAAAITGIVDAYRSAGIMPAKAAPAPQMPASDQAQTAPTPVNP